MNSRFLLLKFSTFTVEFLDFAVELRGWTGESRGTVERPPTIKYFNFL